MTTALNAVRPARPEDVPDLLRLVHELAAYEKAADEVEATEEHLHRALFGPAPAAFCHVAEHDGRVVGLALWFLTFSTWQGVHGIHLEDLYVEQDLRGHGHGTALLTALAQVCGERGYGRLEWAVLDWNEPSIGFYRSLGALPQDEWTTFRLTGEPLAVLAGRASGS